MIEASPIAYLGGMLAVGKQGEQEGGDFKAIRHPPTPLFLWSCSARAEQGRLPRKRQWRHPTAPPHASHTGTLAPCHGPLARGPRRGRRVDVSLGLARGSGCPRKDGLWARPGPRQDGDAWWQGHTRHDRCAQDGGAPPGGPAPPGLWLSRAEAGAPCPLTPPPPPCGVNALPGWRMSTPPRVHPPCPRAARRWPPKPTARASRTAWPRPRCPRVARAPWPYSPMTLRTGTLATSLGAQRPTSRTPTRGPGDPPGRGSASASALGGSMQGPLRRAARRGRRSSPLAVSSSGSRRPQANAGARPAPRAGTPPGRPRLGGPLGETTRPGASLAQPRTRAVYALRKRTTAWELEPYLHGAGSRGGAPAASLALAGSRRERAGAPSCLPAALPAQVPRGLLAPRPRLCLDSPAGSCTSGASRPQGRGRPRARAWPSRARRCGAARSWRRPVRGPNLLARPQRSPSRGRCPRPRGGARAASRVWGSPTGWAPQQRQEVSARARPQTAPGPAQRQKSQRPLLGVVCLLTTEASYGFGAGPARALRITLQRLEEGYRRPSRKVVPSGPHCSLCMQPAGMSKVSPARNVYVCPSHVNVSSPAKIKPRASKGWAWGALETLGILCIVSTSR